MEMMSNTTISHSNTSRQLLGYTLKTSRLSFMVREATVSLKKTFHVKRDKEGLASFFSLVTYCIGCRSPGSSSKGAAGAPVGRGRALLQF